jgi:hypothetical protein
MMVCAFFMTVLFIAACSGTDPVPYSVDTGFPDKDLVPPVENGLPETENVPDTTDPGIVDDAADPVDDAPAVPDDNDPTDPTGDNCKLDADCGAPYICVKAKCTKGCESDADCTNYANTTCNTKLGRCLNTAASEGACNETNCASGCCYAEKGFLGLKCATTATLNVCGICSQGEVYMESKQCVTAACKVGETKCQTYNSYSDRSECFECMADKDFLCADDVAGCTGGSALMMVNVMECVPAGEKCSTKDTCCSGMPCIQGYCY